MTGATRMTLHELEARQPEEWHQSRLFADLDALALRCPELREVFHVPNGGRRDRATAGKLKAQGVKSGIPDVLWPMAAGGFLGLALELKVGANRPTQEQRERLTMLAARGHLAVVAYGWRRAFDVVDWYRRATRPALPEVALHPARIGHVYTAGRRIGDWPRWEDQSWTAPP